MNYQLEMEKELDRMASRPDRPRLLLHACCAPCGSYVLEYLRDYFAITVFYYNPNITDEAEYRLRSSEMKRLIDIYNKERHAAALGADSARSARPPIAFLEGAYEPERFLTLAEGLEAEPEGGARCLACYRLRLLETAHVAAGEPGYEYFTTTLTISPHKDAARLNEIGQEAARKYQVAFLPSDFKKKGGYQRSIELSREYSLYRQAYCGCVFSKRESEIRAADKSR